MSNIQHEADVLDCLEVMLGTIRASKKDKLSTYMLNLRDDPDRIVAKTNAELAKMFAEGKITRELRILHQYLYHGEAVCYRENATDKYPAGVQACLEKMKGLLIQMALERKYKDSDDGRVLGHSATEIDRMVPQQLEEFRKAVCNQRTGGIQIENKVLYYLGNNLVEGTNAGAVTFVHKAIGRRFREVQAIYKDPEMKRTYWIKFENRLVAEKLTEAKRELKTHAELATTRREEAAKKKLEAAAAKKAAATPAEENVVTQEANVTEETVSNAT